MQIAIRRSDTEDVDLIVDARIKFLAHVRGASDAIPPGFELTTRLWVESESSAGRLHSWIAHDPDGAALGVVSLLLWPRPPLPEDLRNVEGYIINMFVFPQHQRQGVGAQLLDACLASAEEFGVRKFLLHSTEAGRLLYETIGFRPKDNWMELPIS